MKWVEYVSCVVEMAAKPEVTRPLGRSVCRQEDDIKIDAKAIG
jgi:hypothetical protein